MKSYYYQVSKENERWEESLPIIMEFSNRENAVNAAYLLSKAFKTTIRFTDNEFYKSNSGAYILAKFD